MNKQELTCPVCKQSYSQVNPPRLLTMCGHTFCHKCIKTFITKRKQKGFKVRCPIDKGSMQMQKPNPILFPKNMVLVNSLHKNQLDAQNNDQQNEFLQISINEKTTKLQQKYHKVNSQEQEPWKQAAQNSQICLLHNKKLEIFCLVQHERICTDCALYTHHRSHQIRNLCQILKKQSQTCNEFSKIMRQKEMVQNKLKNEEIQDQIFQLFDNKKGIIQEQIQGFFFKLRASINQKERQIKQELQIKILTMAERVRYRTKIQKETLDRYRAWQKQAKDLMQKVSNNSNQDMRIVLAHFVKTNCYQNTVVQGKLILGKIQRQQLNFIESIQLELDALKLRSNIQPIISTINSEIVILLEDPSVLEISNIAYVNPLPVINQNKLKIRYDYEQQSLLDFDESFPPLNNPLGQSVISCDDISVISTKSLYNKYTFKNKTRISTQKDEISIKKTIQPRIKRSLSIDIKERSIPRSISFVRKSSDSRSCILKKVQPHSNKISTLISDIYAKKLQTIDLTGQELGIDKVLPLVQAVSKSPYVKTLKLMRNKLDDQFVFKAFKLCLNVERLNIAQNKLTQLCIDKIIDILKGTQNYKLRYLNLGQNRIVQRKNRKILQEFKKLQINIIL